MLLKCEPTGSNIELISALANNVLRTAEKASRDMGFGCSDFTFMQTAKTLVLMRCLNEGKNPLGPEPGKSHIHLVLLIDNPHSLGIAKMEISNVIQHLAEDFRTSAEESGMSDSPDREKETPEESNEENVQGLDTSLDHETVDKAFDDLPY